MNIIQSDYSNDMPSRRIGPGGAYSVSLREGTTAGGTEIIIFSDATLGGLAFTTSTKAWFDPDNCNLGNCANPPYPCSDADEVAADKTAYINDRTLVVVTPRMFEGGDSILLDLAGDGFACVPDVILSNYADGSPAYTFKTLAYTADQGNSGPGSQGVGVVDTLMNGPFATKSSMPLDPAMIPIGMAYNRGDHPGRTLFVVDAGSGDVVVADASNFAVRGTVILQSDVGPDGYLTRRGAIDVAMDHSGQFAYVAHMTYGGRGPTSPPSPGFVWNPSGSVSIIKLRNDGVPPGCPGGTYPCVLDRDGDPLTTTGGAPAGISRIEPPEEWAFVPLSIKDIYVPRASENEYVAGDRYPGEYLFLSGVGPTEWGWVPNPMCLPGWPCPPIHIILPRPVVVGIVDLNPWIVNSWVLDKGYTILNKVPNPYYQQFVAQAHLRVEEGTGGEFYADQGLGFHADSKYGVISVYAVNPNMGTVANLRFRPGFLPNIPPFEPPPGDPLVIVGTPIPVGPNPTDVKVQKVLVEGQYQNYAYITNSGDDTVAVMDTATNTNVPLSPIDQLQCKIMDPKIHYPTSIDTRSIGDRGYSADFASGTVSVYDLPTTSMFDIPNHCEIAVGEAPIRIVVQPVPQANEIFGVVQNSLAFAQPTDFTTPSKQSILIRDWEAVNELQQTPADSNAVVANINNFQKNVNKWMTNTELEQKINEGVNLYKAAYIHDHPTMRQ